MFRGSSLNDRYDLRRSFAGCRKGVSTGRNAEIRYTDGVGKTAPGQSISSDPKKRIGSHIAWSYVGA